jgi:hypothetical protein
MQTLPAIQTPDSGSDSGDAGTDDADSGTDTGV